MLLIKCTYFLEQDLSTSPSTGKAALGNLDGDIFSLYT